MKARLRRCLLSKRAALTRVEIEQKSAAIAAQVCAMPAFRVSHTIMVYLAQAQEVQTAPIIEAARHQGKRLTAPVVEDGKLIAVDLPFENHQLRRGAYGILEPPRPAAVVRPEAIQYIVVPGVAFDRRGGRLGFGKGYYDRFLSHVPPTTYYCGLAFSLQIVPCVPRMPHDVCMHGIVTEQGFIPCNSNPAHQPDSRLVRERYKGEFR